MNMLNHKLTRILGFFVLIALYSCENQNDVSSQVMSQQKVVEIIQQDPNFVQSLVGMKGLNTIIDRQLSGISKKEMKRLALNAKANPSVDVSSQIISLIGFKSNHEYIEYHKLKIALPLFLVYMNLEKMHVGRDQVTEALYELLKLDPDGIRSHQSIAQARVDCPGYDWCVNQQYYYYSVNLYDCFHGIGGVVVGVDYCVADASMGLSIGLIQCTTQCLLGPI